MEYCVGLRASTIRNLIAHICLRNDPLDVANASSLSPPTSAEFSLVRLTAEDMSAKPARRSFILYFLSTSCVVC
jgi:hypothetical protein